MDARFIIVADHPSAGKLVRTKNDRWCFYYPGMNEYLWKQYPGEKEAQSELHTIQKPEGVSGLSVCPFIF